jgi:hypothetical protein
MSETTNQPEPLNIKPTGLITQNQGRIIILILLLVFASQFSWLPIFHPKWEYKSLEFYGSGGSRTGTAAMQASTILWPDAKITEMGEQGWELVGTYLETETAYPNFGNDDYVTGLRENIRPQKLVLIFKRKAGWW